MIDCSKHLHKGSAMNEKHHSQFLVGFDVSWKHFTRLFRKPKTQSKVKRNKFYLEQTHLGTSSLRFAVTGTRQKTIAESMIFHIQKRQWFVVSTIQLVPVPVPQTRKTIQFWQNDYDTTLLIHDGNKRWAILP